MIGWLGGSVRSRDPLAGVVTIEAGGVGYQVVVSWQTFARVPEPGQRCELHIHTHVREDVLALYGFADPQERRMFLLLTSVPQVGPKLAIGVLGGLPLPELLAAIGDGERATLERIPGVGKKTAERILVDLKDKVEALKTTLQPADGRPRRDGGVSSSALREEAQAVLVNLGWKPKLVESALAKALDDDAAATELDPLVRRALALLMAR
jgi:Holliday junction DNA helicase RuvA